MKLKLPPTEIDPEDPFAHDALGREETAKFLTNLIARVDPPFVFCIDSPWGTGKTTFLQMWKASLTEAPIEPLYFNCWITDFAEDPLVAFVAEIATLVSQRTIDLDGPEKETLRKVKKATSLLARRAIPVAGKLATAGILDLNDFQESALAEFVGSSLKDVTDAYLGEKKLIDEFRIEMGNLVKLLSQQSENTRLVVLVDELDRCRPTYAIELLERIKHLFNIPNVVFVLAMDKSQIQISIEAIYGRGIDTAEYLRRFIDLDFKLPPANGAQFTNHMYSEFEVEKILSARKAPDFRYDGQRLVDSFNAISNLLRLSLRAREQCFTRLRIAMMSFASHDEMHPVLLAVLVILRTVKPEIYAAYINNSDGATTVLEFLRELDNGISFLDSRSGHLVEAFLILGKSLAHAKAQEYLAHQTTSANEDADAIERSRSDSVLDYIQEIEIRGEPPDLGDLNSRIDLVAQIRG